MRILRSHYMQLQKNVNTSQKTNSTTTTTQQNVTAYKQQNVRVQRRPSTVYKRDNVSHNPRRNSRSSYYTCDKDGDSVPLTLQQTMARTSTITKSSTVMRHRSLSVASSVDTESSLRSAKSSSSSATTVCSSGYETLHQNTGRTKLQNNNTILLKTQEQQALNQSSQCQARTMTNAAIDKTTMACGKYMKTSEQYHHMHIKFTNVPENVGNINLSVEFVDMGPKWLTKIYQTYENDLWSKEPRVPATPKCKWYFKCTFCQKRLCQFCSLKSHLNGHLELYPYICKICSKPYTGRSSLVKHLKQLHGVESAFDNYMGP